ncbi:hypothetical protein [Anaerotignum sp.]|uniref:hypothetical protein n=1 Tax=Anaerotignum sp. TaxID=2039241 RepID=UPI002A91B5F5|nr:hypothetical protein [Anaerotignum sp.]MCI7656637.1 hypothetical protein [Clostridia bacterium]MDY5414660.1 hypothetical protein [Anaerotignum sp.]
MKLSVERILVLLELLSHLLPFPAAADFRKGCIFFWSAHMMDEIIASALFSQA